jgi:tartrate dehydrogenase/decarboxylase/D-malate dehydrogenase
MMLDHLGHEDAGAGILSAIENVLKKTDVRTPDLKGSARTSEVTDAILNALEKPGAAANKK